MSFASFTSDGFLVSRSSANFLTRRLCQPRDCLRGDFLLTASLGTTVTSARERYLGSRHCISSAVTKLLGSNTQSYWFHFFQNNLLLLENHFPTYQPIPQIQPSVQDQRHMCETAPAALFAVVVRVHPQRVFMHGGWFFVALCWFLGPLLNVVLSENRATSCLKLNKSYRSLNRSVIGRSSAYPHHSFHFPLRDMSQNLGTQPNIH